MKRTASRAGYAMVMALGFIVLFLALYSVSYRHTAPALRLEQARALRRVRDEGSMMALARALSLLETGLPPSTSYVCGVTVNTAQGARSFTVTFSLEGTAAWSVHAVPAPPGTTPIPMPSTFVK